MQGSDCLTWLFLLILSISDFLHAMLTYNVIIPDIIWAYYRACSHWIRNNNNYYLTSNWINSSSLIGFPLLDCDSPLHFLLLHLIFILHIHLHKLFNAAPTHCQILGRQHHKFVTSLQIQWEMSSLIWHFHILEISAILILCLFYIQYVPSHTIWIVISLIFSIWGGDYWI